MAESAVTEPGVQTEQPASTEEEQGFSLNTFFEKREQPANQKPSAKRATPKEDTKATNDPPKAETSTSDEGKEPEDAASVTPPGKVSETKTTAEPQSEATIPKHEKEKFKLREAKRLEKERADKLEKELLAIKEKYGELPEPSQGQEPDPVVTARLQERIAISRDRFIKTHTEAVLTEKITGEDSPWVEIEAKAKAGDPEAQRLQQRVFASADPFEEALAVLEEQSIFEQYGTRNISQIIAKALAEHGEAIEAQVMAKISPTRHETGKETSTLGKVSGSQPRSETEEVKDFSLSTYFGQRK